MKTKIIGKNTTPLCFLPDGRLLSYHRGKVGIQKSGKTEKRISIPISLMERIWGNSRLISRLLRFGVRAAVAIDSEHTLVSIGKSIYELDLDNGIVSKGWHFNERIRPLIFSEVVGVDGFQDGIYFGGYLVNMGKKPVNIYKRTGKDQWDSVYTFPQGTINHVHNIVADKYRQCLWIFTGDYDESAAIWKVTENFQKVERVVCNNQKYRGCVVFVLPEGLLYATDAPYADNYIYLLDPLTYEAKPVFPIDGSCIYGCQWKDKYVFSSTVEGDGRTSGGIKLFYHGDKGVGIKDDYVHMYYGGLNSGFEEIYKEKKDRMSFFFQLGVFKFPYGKNDSDSLYFQPMATNKNDLKLMEIRNNFK